MKKFNILRYSVAIGISLLWFHTLFAQVQRGQVIDENGNPVVGAMVRLYNNPSESDITDREGWFTINAPEGGTLEINYGDFRVKKVDLKNENHIFQLTAKDNFIDMGNGVTTASRQTQSIATIGSEVLERNASPRIGDALYGLLPGLSVMQNVDWDGIPSLTVRGGNPLIVVDGVPRAMETLNVSEIESVTILKDAAATALWGARGANGVLLVTTKRGIFNTKKIDVNYKFGMGVPINQPQMADAYTYAKARNEALFYDGKDLEFTDLESIRNGTAGYSNVNWNSEALRNYTTNHQLDFTFRGGGKRLRYFAILGYKNDVGIFNPTYTDMSERYQSQLKRFQLNARINLDVELAKYTRLNFSILGQLYQTNAPGTSLSTIFNDLYSASALAFPVRTSQGVWGANTIMQRNPIAQICDVGYQKYDRQLLQSNLRMAQDLSMITPGLSAEVMVTYDMSATYRNIGTKQYSYQIGDVVYGGNEALSITNDGLNASLKRAYAEAKLGYKRDFGKHDLNTALLYRYEYTSSMGRNNTQKRQYLLGQVGYAYDNRYLFDVVVNYYGTSYLQSGGYYRTYPAMAASWVVSNEKFFSKDVVNLLKVRASYGVSGYDAIGYDLDKQYWISKNSYSFGDANASGGTGYGEGPLPVEKLELQKATKTNIGIDVELFNRLALSAEVFTEKRRNIMVDGSKIIPAHIGITVPKMPVGANNYKGGEFSLSWNDKIGDFSYYAGGNISYVRSTVIENGEGYVPYANLSGKGLPVGQLFGLEAIGYFRDQADIDNSLPQNFSEVRPGDIKYRDVNNDGMIDDNDRVAIGYNSSIPEIYYGFNLGFKYKNFGIDLLFQGAAHYSKILNTANVYWPLRNNTNISMWYLDDNVRWTEETRDIANLPRLTTLNNDNNFRTSTQWLADASFLKLRNLNIYYNLPQRWTRGAAKIEQVQLFVRGNNLFSLDKIKYLNCEDLTTAYPDLMNFYVGANIKF